MASEPAAWTPTVSVVIPAYNHGRYVAEAIDSVLAQDYADTELLVIDDGSTDETAAVIAPYAHRARVMSQPNVGQARTINRGWADARGDVLSYLSADDRLEPGAISTAVQAFREHADAAMVYGDYVLIDPASVPIRHVVAPEFDYVKMVRDLICAPGPGVFIRRSVASRTDGWNPELRQVPDFEYWLRLSLLGTFVRIPHVLAALRVHPGSASYAPTTPARAEEPVSIMEAYFSRADLPRTARAVQRRAMSTAHLHAARAHLRARRHADAIAHLRQALSLAPANAFRPRSLRLLVNALVNRTGHRLLWLFRRMRSGVWRH